MKIKRKTLVNNNAITLISLVITIVVLIILVGVAINMTIGENGIFKKAQEAKKMQTIATAKEQIGTEILSAQVEAIERNEELEQTQVEDIISKYGELQEDGDTIILNDNGYEVSLLDIYNGTTTTTGSYTENKAKIALLESQVELLEQQKADLQQQLEDLASSEGDQTQKIVELTAEIQTLEQSLIEANTKVEEYENLKETLSKTTVTEDKILKDYKAYKNGQLITGTMENYAGKVQDATVASDDNYTYLSIPSNGYYTTDSKLRTSNSDLNNYFLLENKEQNANVTYTYDLGFTPSRVFILDGSFRYVWAYYNINISTTTYQGWYNVEYDNAQLGNTSSNVYFDIEDTIIKYKLPNSHKPTTIIAFK